MNGITYGVIVEEYTLNGKTRVAYGVAAYAHLYLQCGEWEWISGS